MESRQSAVALELCHHIGLADRDALEQQFMSFAARAARRHGARQSLVVCSRGVHRRHKPLLPNFERWRYEDRMLGMPLRARSKRLRSRWAAKRTQPDVVLLWNEFERLAAAQDAFDPRRCLYWEHGAAWQARPELQTALARESAVLCSSFAARRMLELRFDYPGISRVCPNGMRSPHHVADFKHLHSERPLQLGMAGALTPVAGVPLMLHGLRALHNAGVGACLNIVGTGPAREALERQARVLGLSEAVRFLGEVDDMALFFSEIDLFVHAVLHDAGALAPREAAAMGCPVVCTRVDAMPEVVVERVTGICVPPRLTLADYRALGGSAEGLPDTVYDPEQDALVPPQACAPADLAQAIIEVVSDAELFSAMSHAAIERVKDAFDFDTHVDDVMAAVAEYRETGTLEARS